MSTASVTQTVLPPARAPITDGQGYVMRDWLKWFQSLVTVLNPIVPQFLSGSHAVRLSSYPASSYPTGSVFYETDRAIFYVAISGTWQYESGTARVTQATLPTDLTAGSDVGFLAYVTDYAHLLRWNGTGWEWGPGDDGSDRIVAFVNQPSPATGWHICDGSTQVLQLLSDGTRQFVTVPNTAGSWYRQ